MRRGVVLASLLVPGFAACILDSGGFADGGNGNGEGGAPSGSGSSTAPTSTGPATCTTVGPKSPNDATKTVGDGIGWSNVANARASDDLYATSAMSGTFQGQNVSGYLVLSDFGFAVPAAAKVAGIEITLERHGSASDTIADDKIILYPHGTNGDASVSNRSAPGTWQTDDVYAYYGGDADTWGETLTGADVSSIDFGIGISARLTSGTSATASVDTATVTVVYCQ